MTTQVVTQLIVDASGAKQGVAEFEAAMKRAKDAAVQGGTVTATSFDRAQKQWTESLGRTDPIIKAQIAQEKALERQRTINTQAVKLGIVTQEAANAQLDRVRVKYQEHVDAAGKAAFANTTLGKAVSGVSGQLIALSSGAGPAGVFLAALGPWGIAAAVGLGVAERAIFAASNAAHKFADDMGKVRDNAEGFRLTTLQLQAINDEGSKFALTEEKIGMALQRFTSGLDDLRRGTGDMFDLIRRIDPALAKEMAQTRDTAAAIDVLRQVYEKAGDSRSRLDRLIGGRTGGAAVGGLFSTLEMQKVTDEFRKSGDAIDDGMIKKVAQLKRDIDDMSLDASRNIASIFSVPLLQVEFKFVSEMRDLSRVMKEFSVSKDWDKFISGFADGGNVTRVVAALTAAIPGIGQLMQALSAAASVRAMLKTQSGAASFDESGFTIPAAPAARTTTPKSEIDRTALEFEINAQKARIAAMGDAATAAQKLQQRERELKLSLVDNVVSLKDYNKAVAAARTDKLIIEMGAAVSALNTEATVTELQTYKLAQLSQQLQLGKISWEIYSRAVAGVKQQEATRAQQDMISALGGLASPMDEYKLHVMQLEQQLRQGRISQETFNAAVIAASPAFRAANDGLNTFISNMTSGLMSGKSFADSLAGSLNSVASKMQQIGSQELSRGIMSGISGNGFNFDPVSLGVGAAGIGIGLIANLITANQKKKRQEEEAAKAHAEAMQRWKEMALAFEDFTRNLQGGVTGQLSQGFNQLFSQGRQFADAFWKAHVDEHGNSPTETITFTHKLVADFNAAITRLSLQFQKDMPALLASLRSGVGLDQGVGAGIAQAKQPIDQLKGFIDDVRSAFSALDWSLLAGGAPTTEQFAAQREAQRQVAVATEAVNIALLSLVSGPDPLSDIAQKLQMLEGTALAVSSALQDLGLSTSEVADRVAMATAKIHAAFTDDLQRQLNEATGKGFINEILDLMTRTAKTRSDAALFGNVDISLIDTLYTAQLQKIVDGAGLVGTAFDDLIAQFPQLTGVVHESTQALEEQRRAFNAAGRTIVDYINGVLTGQSSPLSPQARLTAAQSTYATQYALAQGGNADALSRITQDAENLRDALQAMYGSTTNYQQGWTQIANQLLALPVVQNTTDPVVAAVRDAVTAIIGTTTSVDQVAVILDYVRTFTEATKVNTSVTVDKLGISIGYFSSTVDKLSLALSQLTSSTSILGEIRSLNQTQRTQLDLLTQQYSGQVGISGGGTSWVTWGPTTNENGDIVWVPTTRFGSFGVTSRDSQYTGGYYTGSNNQATNQARITLPTIINNSMLSALNKIVFNTFATAHNTAGLNSVYGGTGGPTYIYGIYAQGGVIPPHGLGLTQEHGPRGPQWLRAGAEPIHVFPGSAANDNGAVVAELRRLYDRIAQLESRLVDAEMSGARRISDGIDELHDQGERWMNEDARANRSKVGRAA